MIHNSKKKRLGIPSRGNSDFSPINARTGTNMIVQAKTWNEGRMSSILRNCDRSLYRVPREVTLAIWP